MASPNTKLTRTDRDDTAGHTKGLFTLMPHAPFYVPYCANIGMDRRMASVSLIGRVQFGVAELETCFCLNFGFLDIERQMTN